MSGAASNNSGDHHVVVVGAGLSGLATALGAALQGRSVTVFEAADQVGGAAAYSGGQVWIGANHVAAREGIEDDLRRVERYVRAIAAVGDPALLDEAAMLRWLTTAPEAARYWEEVGAIRWEVIPGLVDYHSHADGALGVGRYLTNELIDGSVLGPWRSRLRVSPHFPVGATYDEVVAKGRRRALLELADDGSDPLTFGTGVVASFLARVLREARIELLTSHPVVELLRAEDGTVSGAVAEGPSGPVRRHGPVVLATSSFDWDPGLVEELLGIEPENFGSVAPRSLRGDGLKLARSAGAAIARIPAIRVPMLPGWEADNEPGFTYGPEYALPHAITVDAAGHRFCDDSYYIDMMIRALDPSDRHLPCYLIWDEQHRQAYGFGETPPGGRYPDGFAVQADSLRELGERLGVDGGRLEATVRTFNAGAAVGEDPEFGRGSVPFVRSYAGDPAHAPNPLLGPLSQPPFYGKRLRIVGTGIGSSGVHIDGDGRVLDDAGDRIGGLYAVGSCAALTSSGAGYNSGFALGRGLTLAYLVSHELGAQLVPESLEAV
jgi:3-oxosteroid 1-dehydrogenase